MFNLQPGQGLGFSGSKEIAYGLAPFLAYTPEIPVTPPIEPFYVGGGGGGPEWSTNYTIYDNAYSAKTDDNEVIEILCCIIPVIE